jgi:hypothetical protein
MERVGKRTVYNRNAAGVQGQEGRVMSQMGFEYFRSGPDMGKERIGKGCGAVRKCKEIRFAKSRTDVGKTSITQNSNSR